MAHHLLQRLKVFAADKLHHLSHGGKPFEGPNEQRQLMLLDATGIKHVLVDGVQRGEKAAWGSTPPTRVRAVVCMLWSCSVSFVV